MMQWGIEAVAAAASAQVGIPALGATQTGTAPDASAPSAFANLMHGQLGELNASMSAAETAMSDLAAGKAVELHDVMIAIERARISVQTFIQVRNKLIESYQDVMRMQL
jgi:flagellar hook-basal body complex protein FliE